MYARRRRALSFGVEEALVTHEARDHVERGDGLVARHEVARVRDDDPRQMAVARRVARDAAARRRHAAVAPPPRAADADDVRLENRPPSVGQSRPSANDGYTLRCEEVRSSRDMSYLDDRPDRARRGGERGAARPRNLGDDARDPELVARRAVHVAREEEERVRLDERREH